jgi:ubiquinone/menaquinone biosynthesis C-methylase UbiE
LQPAYQELLCFREATYSSVIEQRQNICYFNHNCDLKPNERTSIKMEKSFNFHGRCASEPLWLLLMDKWDTILYQRDKIFPRYDLSGRVLEIGCGRRGWFSLMVKAYFRDSSFVVTTDILADKVRKAKDIAVSLNCESDGYVVADVAHLPFCRNIFQKIIGCAVLHHAMPNIDLAGLELHRVTESSGMALFTGEIVASRFLGWIWKKMSLEKIPGEGIATETTWRKAFLNAGFPQVKILREHRYGYHQSITRNIYYRFLKHIPDEVVLRWGLTSVTIIADT